MYAGASGIYGVYLLVDRTVDTTDKKSSFNLLKISEINIQNGAGQCNVMVNPKDILDSAYHYDDIEGMAIKADGQSYYTIFSLWNEDEVDVNKCNVLPKEHKKNMKVVKVVNPISEITAASACLKSEDIEKQESALREQARVIAFPLKEEVFDKSEDNNLLQNNNLQSNSILNQDAISENSSLSEESNVLENRSLLEESNVLENRSFLEESAVLEQNAYDKKAFSKNEQQTSRQSEIETNEIKGFEQLLEKADNINAFCDDDLYDCIEVTPQQIEKAIGADEIISGNSFLIHGYYNFKHILLGRVADNDRHTKYFIGVPGIYCNRERYMASMFGFVNFKKSHRSDYANPHFGYWYQEI